MTTPARRAFDALDRATNELAPLLDELDDYRASLKILRMENGPWKDAPERVARFRAAVDAARDRMNEIRAELWQARRPDPAPWLRMIAGAAAASVVWAIVLGVVTV